MSLIVDFEVLRSCFKTSYFLLSASKWLWSILNSCWEYSKSRAFMPSVSSVSVVLMTVSESSLSKKFSCSTFRCFNTILSSCWICVSKVVRISLSFPHLVLKTVFNRLLSSICASRILFNSEISLDGALCSVSCTSLLL